MYVVSTYNKKFLFIDNTGKKSPHDIAVKTYSLIGR